MSPGLAIRSSGEILTFVLSRPERSNAFGPEEADVVLKFLNKPATCGAVVFRAEGSRVFCSGGDLEYYSRPRGLTQGLNANRKIMKALRRLATFPVPTLAVVTGDCLGGGLELLGAFDEVWALPHVRFGFWQRRIGLTFGWGGFSLLSRRVSDLNLRRHALSAGDLTAFEAARIGLVDQVVGADQLEDRILRWGIEVRRWPKSPVSAIKSLTAQSEERWFHRLWGAADHRQALKEWIRK